MNSILDKLYSLKKNSPIKNYQNNKKGRKIAIILFALVFLMIFLYQDFISKERLKNYKIDFKHTEIKSMEVNFSVVKNKSVNINRKINSSNWENIYELLIKASTSTEYFGLTPRNDLNQGKLVITMNNESQQEYLIGFSKERIKYVYLTQTNGNVTHHLKTVKSENLYDLIFEYL